MEVVDPIGGSIKANAQDLIMAVLVCGTQNVYIHTYLRTHIC